MIAREMQISVSDVKTTLHRTREKIKKLLKLGGFDK